MVKPWCAEEDVGGTLAMITRPWVTEAPLTMIAKSQHRGLGLLKPLGQWYQVAAMRPLPAEDAAGGIGGVAHVLKVGSGSVI